MRGCGRAASGHLRVVLHARLHGHEKLYAFNYTEEQLRGWAQQLSEAAGGNLLRLMNDRWPQHQLPDNSHVPGDWQELAEQARQARGRIIIIGGTDAGKSTLCWWLAQQLAAENRVAVVDADLGQSRVGPPASVGWRFVEAAEGEFYFVGDVTPARRPAACLAATIRLAQRARAAGAEVIIVDTSGYVNGSGAVSLKTAKVELLAPALVIMVGAPGELAHLASPFAGDERIRIAQVLPAGSGSEKTVVDRQRWRRQHFAAWLAGSTVQWLSLAGRAVSNLPSPREFAANGGHEAWRGLLVGLLTEERLGLGLGLLRGVDYQNNRLLLAAPDEAQQAAGVHLGSLRLEPDGTSIPGRPKYV